MPKITRDQVKVPADVLADVRETYVDNYMKATRGTGRLMLFACDQKVEHLNKDFYGEGIDIADAAAVGDTYNDIPMLERVGHSFIVDNAEEHMNANAKWRIPRNNQGGVMTLIDAILAAR